MEKYDFDFSDQYSKNISINLDDSFELLIQRQSNSTAIIYCRNKDREIKIPNGFKIINKSSSEFIYPNNNIYILCWTDNYIITYNQIKINLYNKHCWDVSIIKQVEDLVISEDYPGSDCTDL